MSEKIKQFALRLTPDLHAALVALAAKEGRSLHGQIIFMLRRAVMEERHHED
jgi:hypothetical protein